MADTTNCVRCGQALGPLESHFATDLLPNHCIASRAEYARLESGNGFGIVVKTSLVESLGRPGTGSPHRP